MATADGWLISPRPRPQAAVRLVCLPFAGGGANAYRSWAPALPPTVELCLAQLPGREVRFGEPPLTRAGPILEALLESLESLDGRPVALFGHSMGALLAFELARRLEASGSREVASLIVSGRAAPHLGDKEHLHQLPELELTQALRRLNGTPEEVLASAELMRLLLPVLRADLAVVETHAVEAGAQVRCPLVAMGGQADPHVDAAGVEAWSRHAQGPFRRVMYEGDHFFVQKQQRSVVREVALELARRVPGVEA